MKKLTATAGLDKKEWLMYRKRGIGGSDAGAVCGLNPYRTAMQVYEDKTTDKIEEFDNEAMRQGREFEDYVAKRFTEATGKKVRRANFMYYDENYPFMFADVDRMIVGKMPDWNVRRQALIWLINGKTGKCPCIISYSVIIICLYVTQMHGI